MLNLDNLINIRHNKLEKKIKEYLNQKIYDLLEYEKIYEDFSNEWYSKFIYERIKSKKTEGYNPTLSDNMIIYLQNEKNFIDYFKNFLQLKNKTDFYVKIENDIINDSREKNIDSEGLGMPTIDKNLREKNYKYTLELGKNCDNMYTLIYEYLNLIENINEELKFNLFLEMKID